MPLKSIIAEIVAQIPGALGAVLIDWEGEAVEHVSRMDDYELKVMGAHHGVILDNLRRASERLGKGPVEEITIHAGNMTILVTPVTRDYFLVLSLDKQALAAQARAVVRALSPGLRAEVC